MQAYFDLISSKMVKSMTASSERRLQSTKEGCLGTPRIQSLSVMQFELVITIVNQYKPTT